MISLTKTAIIKNNRSLLQRNLIVHYFCVIKTLNPNKPKGKLSIIPTPIGNLNDLTPNILKCLFKADLIGCQDRRVAGQLYSLIRNKKIIQQMEENFGSLGLTSLIPFDEEIASDKSEENQEKKKQHQFYDYSQMSDKQRRKFLAKLTLEEEKQFKIQYLKYRAKKIVNKNQQFAFNEKGEKFDELYGLEVSDFKHIQSQIINARAKKGRGLLIPLNTYSETKMFDLVKVLLESKHVAIVSDAGMPCISDPGWKIIKMLRQSMSDVDIEVIGGPSAVDIMLTLSMMTQKNNSMSGRFEGFAAPQVSNMTQEGITLNESLKISKQADFSIHFINSKKLKKNVYSLQKIYGKKHKIVITNQLTKKFERKFHGNIEELTEYISKQKKQFTEGIGEMSYLLYRQSKIVEKEELTQNKETQDKKNQQNDSIQQKSHSQQRYEAININNFIQSLNFQTEQDSKGKQKKIMGLKDKAQLVCAIFGLKYNQAKTLVYSNESLLKANARKMK